MPRWVRPPRDDTRTRRGAAGRMRRIRRRKTIPPSPRPSPRTRSTWATAPVDTLAASHSKNIPLVVIAPASPVRHGRDLNGKVIAVAGLHGLTVTASRVWIDQNGADSSTVKFLEMPFPAMPVALTSGRIDAAFITEPFLGEARKNGRALAYGFDGIAKHFLVAAWFTSTAWAQANPDLVARFAGVMHETAMWANRNEDKSSAIFAKYTKLDPAVIATMVRGHYTERFTPALMQPLIDASAKYNGFRSFAAQDLMDASAR
jgi:NitT/TauT family transport system substrate-binding protein